MLYTCGGNYAAGVISAGLTSHACFRLKLGYG
jgi:hypothetical protein